MKIRRYMANNMQEALLKVKMDLGNDAVILNTRKVKRPGIFGFLRTPLIEILASLEEEEEEIQKIKEVANPKVDELENKVKSMEDMLTKIYDQISTNSVKTSNATIDENRLYDVLVKNMQENDVEQDTIDKLISALKQKGLDDNSNVNEVFQMFHKELIRTLGQVSTIKLEGSKRPAFG